MTQIELMEAQFVLMAKRIQRLEERLKVVGPLGNDKADAGRVAVDLGIDPLCVVRGDLLPQRMRLAFELSRRGWRQGRIATALDVCERTVQRWLRLEKAKASSPK